MARRRDSSRSLDGKTPTETTPPRLPRPPDRDGPVVKPPRIPSGTTARPGRRADAPSDAQDTSRIDRIVVEPTPAPLPPSPAAADAERWFEQVPTNPGVPTTPAPRSPTGRTTMAPTTHTTGPRAAPAWLFPVLLALTALTVGMVLGALLFGRNHTCPPTPPAPALNR